MTLGVNCYLVRVVTSYYHNSSIFHRHQHTGCVINAYPNTHNGEKQEKHTCTALIDKWVLNYRKERKTQTDRILCLPLFYDGNISTVSVTRHGVLCRNGRIGICFSLLLQPMQTQKYFIQAENEMFAQSQDRACHYLTNYRWHQGGAKAPRRLYEGSTKRPWWRREQPRRLHEGFMKPPRSFRNHGCSTKAS